MWSGLNSQTSRLDQANQRADRVDAIYQACAAQQAKVKALLDAPKPWWKFWG